MAEDLTQKTSDKKSMNSKMLLVGGAVVLLLLAGGLAVRGLTSKLSQLAGEKVAEKMIENAAGGKTDVDINSGQVTVKTDKGTFSTGTDLPKDWPSDVPIYPGSTVTYSGSSTPTDDKAGFSVMLTAKDTVKQVSDYYAEQLKNQSWTIESTQNIATTTAISAVKSGRDLTVTISSSDEGTIITLITASDQP